VRSILEEDNYQIIPPAQASSTSIASPLGKIFLPNNASGNLDNNIRTPQGVFDIGGGSASPGFTDPPGYGLPPAGPGGGGNIPPAYGREAPIKAYLYNTQLGKLFLPYNPESMTVSYPTRFGEYQGIAHVPQVFYGGITSDKMEVRYFHSHRGDTGVQGHFVLLRKYADPANGGAHNLSDSTFSAPPLTTLVYGGLGSFLGYVEGPRMEASLFRQDLTPVQAYFAFTFVVVAFG
jgi:hypothetical protein